MLYSHFSNKDSLFLSLYHRQALQELSLIKETQHFNTGKIEMILATNIVTVMFYQHLNLKNPFTFAMCNFSLWSQAEPRLIASLERTFNEIMTVYEEPWMAVRESDFINGDSSSLEEVKEMLLYYQRGSAVNKRNAMLRKQGRNLKTEQICQNMLSIVLSLPWIEAHKNVDLNQIMASCRSRIDLSISKVTTNVTRKYGSTEAFVQGEVQIKTGLQQFLEDNQH
ncbi:hypothetical protein GCM10023333_20820 [Ferrimonas pelagia]|uniref:Uncharacterized protein n=2 Tax=Ferrimonas pelagia TaxID=1177826 RepID=A0ABP9EV48_9GAMM